jgi:hypothetical protein
VFLEGFILFLLETNIQPHLDLILEFLIEFTLFLLETNIQPHLDPISEFRIGFILLRAGMNTQMFQAEILVSLIEHIQVLESTNTLQFLEEIWGFRTELIQSLEEKSIPITCLPLFQRETSVRYILRSHRLLQETNSDLRPTPSIPLRPQYIVLPLLTTEEEISEENILQPQGTLFLWHP